MDRKDRAVVGFLAGVFFTALVTKALDEEADALGVPHIVVGVLVAAVAHELD
jgi:hypothetical protein